MEEGDSAGSGAGHPVEAARPADGDEQGDNPCDAIFAELNLNPALVPARDAEAK